MSWCTYPFGYTSENVGLAGNKAALYEQFGFSLADVVAKAGFGILSEPSRLRSIPWSRTTSTWFWWSLAMIPFCYVVLMLRVGLDEATSKQPPLAATRLVSA